MSPLDHYNKIYEAYELAIHIEGVIIVVNSTDNGICLHTLGNTSYGYPELLMFCNQNVIEHYKEAIRNISHFMRCTDESPHPHCLMTVRGNQFYPILVDRQFVWEYARPIILHYNYYPKLQVFQLLVQDHDGYYPQDGNYNKAFSHQPILKAH